MVWFDLICVVDRGWARGIRMMCCAQAVSYVLRAPRALAAPACSCLRHPGRRCPRPGFPLRPRALRREAATAASLARPSAARHAPRATTAPSARLCRSCARPAMRTARVVGWRPLGTGNRPPGNTCLQAPCRVARRAACSVLREHTPLLAITPLPWVAPRIPSAHTPTSKPTAPRIVTVSGGTTAPRLGR